MENNEFDFPPIDRLRTMIDRLLVYREIIDKFRTPKSNEHISLIHRRNPNTINKLHKNQRDYQDALRSTLQLRDSIKGILKSTKKIYVIVSPQRNTFGSFAGNLETKHNLSQANLRLLRREVNLIYLTRKPPPRPLTAQTASYTRRVLFPS